MSKDIILQDSSSGKVYHLRLPCVLGRGQEADLSFPDMTVSHRHALITETDDNQILIEDLNSANGILVNDKKITDKTILTLGDSIQLGKTKLLMSESKEVISAQTVILRTLGPDEDRDLDHERLKIIYEITADLSVNHDIKTLGERIFLKFNEIFRQDRGYIASFQEDGSLNPLCLCSIDKSVPLSKSIINRILQSGESFLLEDALSDASLRDQESIMALKVRSALCVPIIYNNQIYGLIYLDRSIPGAYRQEDLEYLRSIGSILAPLIENTRLWSELNNRYANTVERLRATEAKLIETERSAAYIRLAHAMAHEIRNPVVVIGGMLGRLLKTEPEGPLKEKLTDIMAPVKKIETVLREVDSFVNIPPPHKKLQRIDSLLQEEIEHHNEQWQKNSIRPSLHADTPHVMIPLDAALFKKAVSMVFKEIVFSTLQGSNLDILIRDSGNDIEIVFGETDKNKRLSEPFDPELKGKPWSTSLFLNIAHKILSDHDGKILLDPLGTAAFPVVMRLPKTERI